MHLSSLNSYYDDRKKKKGRKQYDFGIDDYYTCGSRVIWVVRSHAYLNLPGSRCPAFGQRACVFRILLSYNTYFFSVHRRRRYTATFKLQYCDSHCF